MAPLLRGLPCLPRFRSGHPQSHMLATLTVAADCIGEHGPMQSGFLASRLTHFGLGGRFVDTLGYFHNFVAAQ
jgi:hypothetical protein